jgi:hypothetical protein
MPSALHECGWKTVFNLVDDVEKYGSRLKDELPKYAGLVKRWEDLGAGSVEVVGDDIHLTFFEGTVEEARSMAKNVPHILRG